MLNNHLIANYWINLDCKYENLTTITDPPTCECFYDSLDLGDNGNEGKDISGCQPCVYPCEECKDKTDYCVSN